MKLAAALVVLALAAATALLYSGVYDVSATDEHLAPTYWLLDTGMRRSVRRRAARSSAALRSTASIARNATARRVSGRSRSPWA
jgi:hypothetical protein